MGLTRIMQMLMQGASIDTPIANGKSAPQPPSAPNPVKQVNAQVAALPNQVGPTGSVQYTGSIDPNNPTAGSITQTTTLSPEQQALYDAKTKIAQGMLNTAGSNVGGIDLGDFKFSGADNPASSAYFGNEMEMLNRQFDRDETRERQRLANQGLPEGGEAYDTAIEDFRRSKDAAVERAATNALGAGFDQELNTRQQNLNEIANALSGGTVTMPGGSGSGGPSVDVGQAFANQQAANNLNYQGQLSQYGANVGMTNTGIGAAATIAAAFI